MDPADDPGALIVALEAVLRLEQLSDLRGMIEHRLAVRPEPIRWRVATATNELVVAALDRCGICSGVRIYERSPWVHIEVDAPHGDAPTLEPVATDIVAGIARAWGATPLEPWFIHRELQRPGAGTTLWCDIDVES